MEVSGSKSGPAMKRPIFQAAVEIQIPIELVQNWLEKGGASPIGPLKCHLRSGSNLCFCDRTGPLKKRPFSKLILIVENNDTQGYLYMIYLLCLLTENISQYNVGLLSHKGSFFFISKQEGAQVLVIYIK